MRKSISSVVSILGILATPFVALAQSNTVTTSQGIIGLIRFANTALNDVIVLLITLAIVMFFWGLIRYLINAADAEKRKEGMQTMIYGIIAIFVMVSVWGIIHLLQSTFGVSNTDAAQAPSALQIQ